MKKFKIFFRRLFNSPVMVVRNDSAQERIESLRFSVPALRVGVLEYAPGQLTTNNKKLDGKAVKLYYPPEAVSSEKFLKSLETAPVVVGGHDSSTSEHNKKIDGWAHSVEYDEAAKAAMIKGVVKGNKEVAFIRGNLRTKDFGASAFLDIFDIKVESGITPDGQEYNAIAKDLRATHVALAQHVRDGKNKIKVLNAVVFNAEGEMTAENLRSVKVTYSDGTVITTDMASGLTDDQIYDYFKVGKEFNIGRGEYDKMAKVKSVKILNAANNTQGDSMEITAEQIAAIVKNAVKEELAARNAEEEVEELKNRIKNLEDENEKLKSEGEAENEEDKEDKEDKETAENEDNEEGEALENAKPSQDLISAVGTALNVDFGKRTPSFGSLAKMLGITETEPASIITAVNAKYEEIVSKKSAAAGNAGFDKGVF